MSCLILCGTAVAARAGKHGFEGHQAKAGKKPSPGRLAQDSGGRQIVGKP
jgi:hypothetical protein